MRTLFTENEALVDGCLSEVHEHLKSKEIKCRMVDLEFSDACEDHESPISNDNPMICSPIQSALIAKEAILKELNAEDVDIESAISDNYDNVLLFSFASDPLKLVGFAIVETALHTNNMTIIINSELKFIYVKPEYRTKGFSQFMSCYLGMLTVIPLSQDENISDNKVKNISIIGTGESSEYYGPKILDKFFWGLELESTIIDTDVVIDLDFTDEL
jgi:hypothetical protein